MEKVSQTNQNAGTIGIRFLKQIWSSYTRSVPYTGQVETEPVEWKYFYGICNALGIGLEPTMRYLMSETPSLEDFEHWIRKNGRVSPRIIEYFNSIVDQKYTPVTDEHPGILDRSDLEQWEKDGYVIVRNAVPPEDCMRSVQLICDTIGINLQEPETWYQPHPLKQGIMIQLFNSPILDKNRFASKVRLAFEQLWQRSDLMVSNDRVSFNPPETENYSFQGPDLHWDVSLKRPIPFGVQGLLYLTDTAADQGAFTVLPGFHNIIDEWLSGIGEEENPRDEKLIRNFKRKPIAAGAGDLIIWNHCLPHGSSPNTSNQARIVQYINYQPLDLEYQEEWI